MEVVTTIVAVVGGGGGGDDDENGMVVYGVGWCTLCDRAMTSRGLVGITARATPSTADMRFPPLSIVQSITCVSWSFTSVGPGRDFVNMTRAFSLPQLLMTAGKKAAFAGQLLSSAQWVSTVVAQVHIA